MSALSSRVIDVSMTAAGIVLVATPLALWIAPSPAFLFSALATGIVAAMFLCALSFCQHYLLGPPDAPAEFPRPLPDRFVAELHKMSPLVYHHRLIGDRSFERKMDPIRKLLDC